MQASRQKAVGNTARLSLKGRISPKALERDDVKPKIESDIYGSVVSPQGRSVEVGVIKATRKFKKAFKHSDENHKGSSEHHHSPRSANHKSRKSLQSAHESGAFFKFHPEKGAKITQGAASRAAAALIVTAVEEGKSLQEALPYYTLDLDEKDRSFTSQIVYGTLRMRRLLTLTLKKLLTVKIPSEYRTAQNLILCALYQLLYMRSPAHAVVAATVGASSLCRCVKYTGAINAVLRRFLREGSVLEDTDEPAVKHSFPDWLYEKLENVFGKDEAIKIMERSNEHPPMWLRVETDKISVSEYRELLDKAGMSCSTCELAPAAISLDEPAAAFELPKFKAGLVTIQDLSAQLAAPLLAAFDVKDGTITDPSLILDCCAAPGGKSAHLLSIIKDAKLTAVELEASRAEVMADLFKRLGRKAKIVTADASFMSENPEIEGPFDRILVDAPCSGTGVIRRHPDIKWLRRKGDIENLTAIQAKILDEASKLLKAGGVLLYTTCSILPEENRDQVDAFLKSHPNFALLDFPYKGESVNMLQRLPGDDGGDGFFYARFVKRTEN